MPNAEDLKLLGLFLKTHGINGHLVLKLSIFKEDEIEKGEAVFVEIDGIPVPFFISDFRFLSDDSAVIQLDEIFSSKQASEFVNCLVFIRKQSDNRAHEDNNDRSFRLKGFLVKDENFGKSGILQEIIEYPENPVMRIDLNGKEILVPFHENIIRNIDYASRVIEISAPEGLFDLYL